MENEWEKHWKRAKPGKIKPLFGIRKTISDSGRPRTWEWMGEKDKFGIILEKRNPMHIEFNEEGKAKIPAHDVDWWNSVWEFSDFNFDKPPYNVFRMPKYEEHQASFNPFLVEQLIYRYSSEDDTVLDLMSGTGTTLIVSRLMKRHSVGVDISKEYVELTKKRACYEKIGEEKYMPTVYQADSRDLKKLINDESISFIVFSPPYGDIVKYEGDVKNQIGYSESKEQYLNMMEAILKECFRVLKKGKFCACIVSNIRKHKEIPIAWDLGYLGEKVGFILWDVPIHHTSHSRSKAVLRGGQWGDAIKLKRTVRTSEYVLIWKKPTEEDLEKVDKKW